MTSAVAPVYLKQMVLRICILLMAMSVYAQEKSAFEQSLERDTAVSSHESWVEIKGIRYRKVAFDNATYYLRLHEASAKSAELFCEPPFGYQSERLVAMDAKNFKRSRAFIQVFNENCRENHKKKTVVLDPAIGLAFPDAKDALEQ